MAASRLLSQTSDHFLVQVMQAVSGVFERQRSNNMTSMYYGMVVHLN